MAQTTLFKSDKVFPKLPILYSRNSNKSVQQWEIIVEGNSYYTREGLVGGKLTCSKPTVAKGKNFGQINATTDEDQAFAEAKARWTKKVEHGCFEKIEDIDKKLYFECMLAKKYLDLKDKIEFPVAVEYKFDGNRGILSKKGLFTRNGKLYYSCPHIQEVLKPLFEKHPNWVIDGEIYAHNQPFEKICSLIRKTKPEQKDLDESKKIIQFWIYDGVVDDTKLGFEKRYKMIVDEIKSIVGENPTLVFTKVFIANSHEEIDKLHDDFVQHGFEGAMIRILDSPYENKRSKFLLKYKKFFDEEFEISDIIEGNGNRSGMAGNIVLKLKDGREFSASIKGGEDYYKELLIDRDKYIGKYATIRFQNLSEDGIPRFPICVNIGRDDF